MLGADRIVQRSEILNFNGTYEKSNPRRIGSHSLFLPRFSLDVPLRSYTLEKNPSTCPRTYKTVDIEHKVQSSILLILLRVVVIGSIIRQSSEDGKHDASRGKHHCNEPIGSVAWRNGIRPCTAALASPTGWSADMQINVTIVQVLVQVDGRQPTGPIILSAQLEELTWAERLVNRRQLEPQISMLTIGAGAGAGHGFILLSRCT